MSLHQEQRCMRPPQHILEEVSWAVDDKVRSVSRKQVKVKDLQDLLQQEEKFYETIAFSSKSMDCTTKDQNGVPASWRSELCHWGFGVVDHFGLDREVVSTAMNYLDFVKASSTFISKKDYVLLAVASMYLAAKEFRSRNPESFSLSAERLAELCQGARFKVEDIEKSEHFVLSSLNGASNQPSTMMFLTALVRLCPGWESDRSQDVEDDNKVLRAIYNVARHLVEVAAFRPNLHLIHNPSVVAYAAILCAIEALQAYVPLLYCARVQFLNNVAEAANLFPSSVAVLQVIQILKDTCPKMFEDGELITQVLEEMLAEEFPPTSSGRSSPVAVTDH